MRARPSPAEASLTHAARCSLTRHQPSQLPFLSRVCGLQERLPRQHPRSQGSEREADVPARGASGLSLLSHDNDSSYLSSLQNDIALYKAWDNRAFELQVALHELLGHGSGKVLTEKEDGSCNFVQGVINPLTGEPVVRDASRALSGRSR